MADIIAVFCVIVTLWKLGGGEVTVEKGANQSMIKNLRKMSNPATILYFVLLMFTGISFGVTDTYVNVYLQDDLGAPSSMIGEKGLFWVCPFW